MFIYFVEQVWCISERDFIKLNWRTRGMVHEYWDAYHQDHNTQAYPFDHMVEGEDWIDY